MHKNRKIRAGRPSKEKQQEGAKIIKSSDDENEYIADDSDCEKLFQLISRQSSYKNITKTGPNRGRRQDEILIAQAADKAKDKLKDLNMEDVQFFFLSNRKRVFEFQNDKLVDKTIYNLINEDDFKDDMHVLIHKLNIVCKELDESFIEVLTNILKLYQDCRHQNDSAQILSIISHIRDPTNQKQFQYLLNWEALKNITKETRMTRALDDLDEKKGEINKKSSEKVKRKHLEFIESQYKELEEERKQEPLDYLVSKLIMIFNNIQI